MGAKCSESTVPRPLLTTGDSGIGAKYNAAAMFRDGKVYIPQRN
jgi:hypothetical protein